MSRKREISLLHTTSKLCMERSLIIEQRIFSNYSDFYFIFARWNIKKNKTHKKFAANVFSIFRILLEYLKRDGFIENLSEKFSPRHRDVRVIREIVSPD